MLTPWVNPVTAGKKMAKSTQKEGPDAGAVQLPATRPLSHRATPPTKNETSAVARIAITTYWKRVAQSAPSQAKMKRKETATAAMTCGTYLPETGRMSVRASPKPMQ